MKRFLPTLLTLFLIPSILLSSGVALAQTNIEQDYEAADVDDSAPVARVARLSFIDGDVSFLRAGVTEWAPAVENLPLLAGDQIYAGSGARAEVQLAQGNYFRLSEGAALTITELSESAAQFEITEGIAIIRIERLATVFHRFEVDTPNTAVVIQQDGIYRIEVRGDRDSELIVRRGEAEVSTEEGSFKVREGHKLLVDTATTGRLELAVDSTRDDWDQWSSDRDAAIARTSDALAPDYVASYETGNNDFYGVSDLSSYGTWTNYSTYGQCWVPRVSSDWAPYRSGQWLWIPAAGWTWLSSEPWGWAPYHYGRWSLLSGIGWAWIPGFGSAYRGYGYRDYHWRPALVYFFNSPTPRGAYVGWYPLAPGERWRRHDSWRGDDRAHRRDPSPRDGRRRPEDRTYAVRPPQFHHGVTILPADGFAKGNRTGARPTAPGREVSDWINKGARSGLPEMRPSPGSAAPELAENDRRKSRRLAVPPNEIISRPVVTRNPEADSSARAAAPRERRVISTRSPESFTRDAAPGERGSERGAYRRPNPPATSATESQADPGERRSPKARITLPPPSGKVDGDPSVRDRRRVREGGSAAETRNPEGGVNPAKEERRRARQEQAQPPKPRDNGSGADQQREGDARARERRPAADAKPRDDSQPRRAEASGGSHDRSQDRSPDRSPDRSHDRAAPAPRVEPRQERPNSDNQPRQERHQEKQQRQERQQPEQRRKP